MEFKVYQKELELQSRGWIPTFHDVSKEIMEIVKASGVKNGTVCVASHHTTCSVMIQECSHDIDSFDLEYLQHDLLDIMRKMIPDFAEEHQYRHPGPIQIKIATGSRRLEVNSGIMCAKGGSKSSTLSMMIFFR